MSKLKENRMEKLAIVAAARTPQAKAFGSLAHVSAVELGRHAVAGVLEKAGLNPSAIDETVFGNVAGPADSANIGRVIALRSGVPENRIAHTVNRNCASGMEAILAGWHAIQEGRSNLVLVGGTESMSNIPLLARNSLKKKLMGLARSKTSVAKLRYLLRFRPRDFKPIVGIELGLTDPTCGLNMGQTAEVIAQDFAITRDEQDAFAVESHLRATDASERCFMSGEITPFVTHDEELKLNVGPRKMQSMEQLAKLRPIFEKNGSVTPGNSCPLTDGATAMLLTSASQTDRFGQTPLGYISAYSIAGCDPRRMGLGPVFATAQLLDQTGLSLSDFDLIEINEAFAAQVIGCMRAFESNAFAQEHLGRSSALGEIDPSKLNTNGGAIAIGHPVGATGARLVMTLLRSLKEKGLKRGLATLCVGGGQGVAMMVET